MTADLTDAKTELVENVVALSHRRCEGGDDLDRFVRAYLGRAHPDDVLGRDTADVCGAALALWRLYQERSAPEPTVRVYNPDWEQDGWQSPHTVVEIVSEDMPFIIESVLMLMERLELDIHVLIHPLIGTDAVAHLEIDRISERDRLDHLDQELRGVLTDVRAAVGDWIAMRDRAREVGAALRDDAPPLPAEEVAEGADFLEWLADDHFTFLGARDYALVGDNGTDRLSAVPGTGLGLLRDDPNREPSSTRLSAEASRVARERSLLVLSKTNAQSTVHRAGRLDYIGVKQFGIDGEVTGERRFVGIYTRSVYTRSCLDVPVVRKKVQAVLAAAGHPPGSHGEKVVVELLDNAPRDLEFQTPTHILVGAAHLAADLAERKQVRIFVVREVFGRFYNCWLYLPRERYNAKARRRIEEILLRALGGTEIDSRAFVGDSILARLLSVVWVPKGTGPVEVDFPALESKLAEATRSWEEELRDALIGHAGEDRGSQLYLQYRAAFPASYQEDFPARSAVPDIERMEELHADDCLGMALYRPVSGPENATRFKILRRGAPMLLSDTLPLLENLGVWVLDERPYRITPRDRDPIWIYDLGLRLPSGLPIDRDMFQEAFAEVWRGHTESDGFNRLVLLAGLSSRQAVALRAICKYLRQAGTTFSQSYMEDCLARNPSIASKLVTLFETRFDPSRPNDTAALVQRLESELDAVESLDEDRILRRFLATVLAMLRTNYFQTDGTGAPKSYLSFKVSSSLIPEMPLPHPAFEIFVYSPSVEGVHLRGGAIARGGLRWSDRKEDFRTEVLGLMKAQNVKNAVIVPTGAKGGFVVKRPPADSTDREAVLSEGISCYKTFISGLLDITDNMVDGLVVPPPDVVRYDGDDSYLVVAPDKGTATFSDIANAISVERVFWLGDAFASGGSAGYDHKQMGITARGAWESVKRHFRELGTDCQSEDFTAVGVGDMSGDVFGNGMLLSEHIRLVAAFDHRHVFLDPDPDAATGFAERQRLFALPRSSWADYDSTLISRGGGVYPRTAKAIPLSDEVRAALGVSEPTLPPNELIRAILRARVDLLWNGGIGTYVKASWEQHSDAGDRTNDAVRVDAVDLRCKVIGEGGNLGLTQSARVEFAMAGGLVNTDAVDNSAGVDCSDHEVNIKILLDAVVADGDLTGKQRNALLAEMTDEVAELVLEDNREQTRTLVNAAAQAASMRDVHTRYIRFLENRGTLDRFLERLPSEKDLDDRGAAGHGLVSPEFAVLLAYTKLLAYNAILSSDIPDDPYLAGELAAYFPAPIRKRFGDRLVRHPLRREIVATRVANSTVNRAGTSWLFRMVEETGESVPDVVRAHIAATAMFQVRDLWDRILSCEGQVAAATLTSLILELRKLVERATRWLLTNAPLPLDLERTVAEFEPGLTVLAGRLPELQAGSGAQAISVKATDLAALGVPDDLAATAAGFDDLFLGLDIVRAAHRLERPIEEVGAAYFALGEVLEVGWFRQGITRLGRDDRWQTRARAAVREDLYREHITLTRKVLAGGAPPEVALEAWLRERKPAVERYRTTLEDLKACPTVDLTAIAVGLRELRNLV